MAKLANAYPHASFDICSLDSSVLVKNLHNGNLDVGFCISPKIPETIARATLELGTLYL